MQLLCSHAFPSQALLRSPPSPSWARSTEIPAPALHLPQPSPKSEHLTVSACSSSSPFPAQVPFPRWPIHHLQGHPLTQPHAHCPPPKTWQGVCMQASWHRMADRDQGAALSKAHKAQPSSMSPSETLTLMNTQRLSWSGLIRTPRTLSLSHHSA